MTTAKLKLDTWHKNCVVVSASQGEMNARFLEITLVDGGEPLNLEGTTVLIYAEKPDKNVIFNNCKIENAEKGIVSVGLTSQMSALSGKLNCEIHVVNREKSTLKILGLQIRIMPCANSDSAVESTSEFTVLSDAIEQTLEIMDQYSEENIMGKIKSMDGAGSGLDADLLDGKHGSEYATKAQGTKADSAIQGVQGNGTTITPNANKVVNVTPSNIGAVPNTRKVNNKPLSSDITLTPSDIGAAASSHGNHVPTTQTASNKVFLRNDNSWQNVTPANIGAVPTTRKVNSKPLSGDITLSYSDVGAANEQHNHSADEISSGTLPIERGGTNSITSTQALENLGGVPKTRTVNNKALSNDISLTASDVGASASGHSHAFSTLTSKPTTLSGYGITDAVPATRKVNNKALSSDISLTASDVGAATTTQGTKADSALQGVKVNGTLVTPDSNKTINIDATSISAATPEQGAKADSAIQGIQGNGTTITPNANKIVNITPSNIGAVPTSRTVNGKALSSNISLTASNVGAAPYEVKSSTDFNDMTTPGIYTMKSSSTNSPSGGSYHSLIMLKSDNGSYYQQLAIKEGTTNMYIRYGSSSSWSAWKQLALSDHTHSASDLTSGTLPVSRGGTGATSSSAALSNLGITISSGTWTPTLASREGTNPTYSVYYRYAMYYRINNLVYISFHMKANISNQGSNYACVRGLPFTSSNNMNGQGLAIHECFGGIDQYPASANIGDSTSTIFVQNAGGECSLQWRTGDTWIGFSGCYIKA
ncbi:MAG: BppU family phage baseplate upper protein [Acutalibacteraceae bacterium]